MFSKTPQTVTAQAASPKDRESIPWRALGPLIGAHPLPSAAGVCSLMLISGLGLIFLLGNPQAGAPVIRLSLAKIGERPLPPGWREGLAPEPEHDADLVPSVLTLSSTPPMIDLPASGEAIITLPGAADNPSGFQGGLVTAPIAGLTAPSSGGPLPIIASDGRRASDAYARPFSSNGKPKIAIIVGGLGLNAQTTRRAIDELPQDVTLSFVPYSEGLQGWIDLARAAGHEVLLEAPMEPMDYPANDPGPYTLLAGSRPQEIVARLEWLMSRATGYFGLINYLGSRFVESPDAMGTFATALRARGLAFIDDGSAASQRAAMGGGLPRASADRIIDADLTGESVNTQLSELEAAAMRHGAALGSGFAYPLTINAVRTWTAELKDRGLQLAPASAVMKR